MRPAALLLISAALFPAALAGCAAEPHTAAATTALAAADAVSNQIQYQMALEEARKRAQELQPAWQRQRAVELMVNLRTGRKRPQDLTIEDRRLLAKLSFVQEAMNGTPQ